MKGVLILVSLWLVGCGGIQVGTTPNSIRLANEVCATHGGISAVRQLSATLISNSYIQADCVDGFIFQIYPPLDTKR